MSKPVSKVVVVLDPGSSITVTSGYLQAEKGSILYRETAILTFFKGIPPIY